MASVCFYFQVHQPFRLRRYSVFDTDANYFDDYKNAEICRKVAAKCYLPANRLMLDLIQRYGKEFSVSYSITGVALEQLERWAPEVLDTFRALADTGWWSSWPRRTTTAWRSSTAARSSASRSSPTRARSPRRSACGRRSSATPN